MSLLDDEYIKSQERLIKASRNELAVIERTNPRAGYDLPKEFARQMRRLAKLEGRLAAALRYRASKAGRVADEVFGGLAP